MIFVDTSAFYAILDRDDDAHDAARRTWTALLSAETPELLMTSNDVLVESFAPTQARPGVGWYSVRKGPNGYRSARK
jgi:predicted nucleic acid-binding protein